MTSISLEKRAMIRPTGVVSKKRSGAPNIARNICSCIAFAAYQQPSKGAKSPNTEPTAENTSQCMPHAHYANIIQSILMYNLFSFEHKSEFNSYLFSPLLATAKPCIPFLYIFININFIVTD